MTARESLARKVDDDALFERLSATRKRLLRAGVCWRCAFGLAIAVEDHRLKKRFDVPDCERGQWSATLATSKCKAIATATLKEKP